MNMYIRRYSIIKATFPEYITKDDVRDILVRLDEEERELPLADDVYRRKPQQCIMDRRWS